MNQAPTTKAELPDLIRHDNGTIWHDGKPIAVRTPMGTDEQMAAMARRYNAHEEMVKALEWYADRENWRDNGELKTREQGIKARKALATHNP